MAVNLSNEVRTAMMAAIETAIGANAYLIIAANAVPANTTVSDAGNAVLANLTLGTAGDWLSTAANGAVTKAGTWQDTAANNNGTAGHFRIYDVNGTCHIQGNCGQGTGDMSLDNTTIAVNQTVTVTGFTLTAPNA